MIIPLRTDSALHRTPYMNYALIVANVIAFAMQSYVPGFTERLRLNPVDPQAVTFITYAFMHGGWMHIAGNMLFLYIFGNNVNDKMGQWGYLAFYLAGAVFAGLLYALVPSQTLPILGASGAIAAVTGAYLVLFPRSNVTVLFFFFIVAPYEIASLWFILFFFVYDIWANFSQTDGVAHVAHIAGTLFGAAICFILLMFRLLPRDQFDVVALVQRWNKRRQYRDLVNRGYNPFDYAQAPTARSPAPPPPDPRTEQILAIRAQIAAAASNHDLPLAAQLYDQLRQIDTEQVMSRQTQLDLANVYYDQGQYRQAAEAYELFIKHHPKYEWPEKIDLALGLIYGRYLGEYSRARDCLKRASSRLHSEREADMARSELARIEPLLASNQQTAQHGS